MFPLQSVVAASRCPGPDSWHVYQVLDISQLLLLGWARGDRARAAGGVERGGAGGGGGGGGGHFVIQLVILQDISADVTFLVTVNTGVVAGDVIF